MKPCIIITAIFLAQARGDDWNLVHFGKREDLLFQCLQFSFFWDDNSFLIDLPIRDMIADYLAGPLCLETHTVEFVNDVVTQVIENLAIYRNIDFLNNQTQRIEFEETIHNVIQDCSDPRHVSIMSLYHAELPHFLRTDELEPLLNLILVNWQPSLRTMISSGEGRFELRRYAEHALNILNNYYSRYFRYFESILRNAWRIRAEIFFDGRNQSHPYIDHIYDVDFGLTYTSDNPDDFISRRHENFDIRNPPAPQSLVKTLLRILRRCHNFRDEYDSFPYYRDREMTSSEYYLETHLIQFYRVLFFYLEMEEFGIDDDRDIWDGPIPYYVIPELSQALVYDDLVYRYYLDGSMIEILNRNYDEYVPRRDYVEWSRFREANMILDRWVFMRSGRGRVEGMSTTPKNDEKIRKSTKKRKGLFHCSQIKKFFMSKDQCPDTDDCIDHDSPSCSKDYKNPEDTDRNKNETVINYGFLTSGEDDLMGQLLEEELNFLSDEL